jgi:hypothetical protein
MGQEGNIPSHPQPNGPPVTFYLGKGIRGASVVSDHDQFLPVGINGYQYKLKMGARNTVPKEVYQVLMNSRSRSVVVDVEKASRHPRPFGTPPTQDQLRYEQLADYEIELIKEEK